MPTLADLALITPDCSLKEAAWFCAVLLAAVLLPGHALRSMAGLAPGSRWERWALTAVIGTLWTSFVYFLLAVAGWQRFHLVLAPLPFVVDLCLTWRHWPSRARRAVSATRLLGRPCRPILFGLLLAAALAAGNFVRTASLVRQDQTGLRLYGAFYSDKMTNMSPCAALRHGVPPAALRISGYVFPSHYFPHLFVASFDVGAGIDYLDGFWFYAAAFGVVVRSLAVLAFARRMLRSPWLACLALTIFGLARFSPQDKTLDLSFALLLLAICSLDHYRCSRRRRWLALCIVFVAAMPFYEVFTAAAALGGLAVWAASGILGATVRRKRSPANEKQPLVSWPEAGLRIGVAAAACVGGALAVRTLYLGAELASPPEVKFKNVYRDSYKHEWRDRLREQDPPLWMARFYAWKRGKPVFQVADLPGDTKPGPLKQIAGEIIYNLGFAGYFVLRFVNLALFGVVTLIARRRSKRWNTAGPLAAAIAIAGFAVPCILVWGHTAEGQWWETPNIYRLGNCSWMLLVILGTPALVGAVREFWRPRWWIPLGIAVWQVWILAAAYVQRPNSFHHVPNDRLEALAFLRTEVPTGQVAIHPWVHDLIREDDRPDEVAWVYKRHFTLASNLAGCQMFYEGREDHLFINGFVNSEEVYRRRRLRDRFYESPDAETIRAIIEEGGVRWVVADAENPAPAAIAQSWPVAFDNASVTIYKSANGSTGPQSDYHFPPTSARPIRAVATSF